MGEATYKAAVLFIKDSLNLLSEKMQLLEENLFRRNKNFLLRGLDFDHILLPLSEGELTRGIILKVFIHTTWRCE